MVHILVFPIPYRFFRESACKTELPAYFLRVVGKGDRKTIALYQEGYVMLQLLLYLYGYYYYSLAFGCIVSPEICSKSKYCYK